MLPPVSGPRANNRSPGVQAFRVLQFEHFLPRIRALLSCPSIPICAALRQSSSTPAANDCLLVAGWQTKGTRAGLGGGAGEFGELTPLRWHGFWLIARVQATPASVSLFEPSSPRLGLDVILLYYAFIAGVVSNLSVTLRLLFWLKFLHFSICICFASISTFWGNYTIFIGLAGLGRAAKSLTRAMALVAVLQEEQKSANPSKLNFRLQCTWGACKVRIYYSRVMANI